MKRLASLPFDDWPATDRSMWAGLITADDPFGDLGALAHLRETSRAALTKHYGRWLEWLSQSDPEALVQSPEQRATPERLTAWIVSLDHVAPPTRHTYVYGALRVLMAAAPDRDWRVQNHIVIRLQRRENMFNSDRKTGRVLSSSVLFVTGRDLMGSKADQANTPLNAALYRRDGAMIAFFSVMPIRLRSFSELMLGDSVLVSGSRIVIRLSAEMTKTGQDWEAPVPDLLEPLLRTYINKVRPWLMERTGTQHDCLWVTRLGSALAYGRIKDLIPMVTGRELGIKLSPHLFRDAAATTLVRQSPQDALLVRPLLGHADFRTAERHYIHATGIEAGRDHAAVIAGLIGKEP
jgi:integrase